MNDLIYSNKQKCDKNIVLVGLIYDSNLGDQVIFQSTKAMVELVLKKRHQRFEIRFIDLYGRKSSENQRTKEGFITRLSNRIFHNNTNQSILAQVSLACDCTFDDNTAGVLFVGGGLLKFRNQFISEPMKVVLQSANERNIPVMLSAVGVEGYEEDVPECKSLSEAINEKNVKIITTRDDIFTLRNKWIVRKDILTDRVADPACSISQFLTPHPLSILENTIGLGIGRKNLFENYGIECSNERIKNLWISIYKELVSRGYSCVIFTNGLIADYEFAQEIVKELHNGGYPDAMCLERPTASQDLINVISSFKAMIVTRLHASIIGFAYGIPSLGLVWNNKQKMFGESIMYPERFIAPQDYDAKSIVDLLDDAIQYGYSKINKGRYIDSTVRWIEKFIDII